MKRPEESTDRFYPSPGGVQGWRAVGARLLLKHEKVSEGGVFRVFSCVEPCRSFEIKSNRETKNVCINGRELLCRELARAGIVLHGEFTINGFRNRDVRELLFPGAAKSAEELSKMAA